MKNIESLKRPAKENLRPIRAPMLPLLYSQTWYISDLPTDPMSSTFEAGGETSYTGITLTLDATPVPEPAGLLMLCAAAAPILLKRKRSA